MTRASKALSLWGDDLRVAQQSNPASPDDNDAPDVYRFEFAYGNANLCIRCGALRMAGRSSLEAGIGPYIEGGVCEDCGNQDGPRDDRK